MEPIPLIDSISAAAGCGARSHQFDSGDGESDLERPCHQLAFIDGIAHWKSMGFEASSGSCIPSNPCSRTGPHCSGTWHPRSGPHRDPLALTWESPGGAGAVRWAAPLESLHRGPLGDAPSQHSDMRVPWDTVAPSIPKWRSLGYRSPPDSITPTWGGPTRHSFPPKDPCMGLPQGMDTSTPGSLQAPSWAPRWGQALLPPMGTGCRVRRGKGRQRHGRGGGVRCSRCFCSASCRAVSPEKP